VDARRRSDVSEVHITYILSLEMNGVSKCSCIYLDFGIIDPRTKDGGWCQITANREHGQRNVVKGALLKVKKCTKKPTETPVLKRSSVQVMTKHIVA
jgi:hypothetical protein